MAVHCWHHHTDLTLLWPVRQRDKCCHCGTARERGQVQEAGHGRHAPPTWRDAPWSYAPGVDPDRCPDAPKTEAA